MALDLRLPGQWLQAETGGLHQNGMRDHDPSRGRYIQPDPLGIAAGNGVLREYIWLGDIPVAVIDRASGTPKTYYIATGFVDEPLLMTDASQATVWAAALDPYGAATFFGTSSVALDLRLPGQWLEAEKRSSSVLAASPKIAAWAAPHRAA